MNIPKKVEYREHFYLKSSLLSKNDLFMLEEMLIDNPETDRIEIEISFDSTTVSVESIEELFSNPDLPASTDKLYIRMVRWIEIEDYKDISSSISLSLHYNHISCQIHSLDQTWFLGKKSQIEKFFNSKRPWYSWINKLAITFPFLITVLVLYGSFMFREKQYSQMILPMISSIVLIVVTALIYKEKIFPFVRIHLDERKKMKFEFYEWCTLIAAISAFATFVQGLIRLFL